VETSAWTGELVRLRGVEPGDWAAFKAFDADSEAARAGYFIPIIRSDEDAKKWAQEQAVKRPENDDFFWAIEALSGGVAGSINTHRCDLLNGTFEYGISIGRADWGKGYAQDAMKLLFRYMFQERRYQKVTGIVYAFNDQSKRMHEKFGFLLEGRWRRRHYTGGVHHDAFIFGMTAEEFAEKYG